MRTLRAAVAASIALLTAGLMSSCGYEDLNSLTLPGVKGKGDDAYVVRIEFANAMDLVPNSPVRVDDLNVGSVKSVELDGHQPIVTVRLEGDVRLPANAVARIGQTSLLGAKHVEIAAPSDEPPSGVLKDGDTIGLDRAAAYPATEEVLASVSALLNGGGLQHIRTITSEVNKVLSGREGTVRQLLDETKEFVTGLDLQKSDITRALEELDRLAARFERGNKTVAKALNDLPPALRVLRTQRAQLVRTLESLGRFGDLTEAFLQKGGGAKLVQNVDALVPSLRGLADAGTSLTESLWVLGTVVFPLQTLDEYVRGDYYNLTVTLDLRKAALSQGLLEGTPLDTLLGTANGLLGQTPGLGPVPEPVGGATDERVGGPKQSAEPAQPEGSPGNPEQDAPAEESKPPNLLELLLGGGR